jgi:hypothetical protein
MYGDADPETQEATPDPTIAANQAYECDENVPASSNQNLQTFAAEGAGKTPEASTPPCQVPDSVAKSTVPVDRPTVSRSWLPKDTTHQWLSPTPNGGTAAKSVPPPTATPKVSAATSKPSTVLPRRSGILFTARPKNQPVLQLVAAPTPRMTSAAPSASDGRGTSGGWRASFPQVHAQDGSQRVAPADALGEHQGTGPAPVSILKTPRFQGGGSASPDEEDAGTPVFTPPPPVAHAVETHTARASLYDTPAAPHDRRRVVPTGPAATAAAVTPGTGSAGKKTVSFDPVKLTETFVIPRAPAAVPGPEAAAAATSPMPRRQPGNVVPMDLEGDVGKTAPEEDGFDFDATDHAFMMSCRESIDRVKVMNDEILDLNVYLSALQADTQILQANMMDVANDTDDLCRGYEDILELLAKEFPEED